MHTPDEAAHLASLPYWFEPAPGELLYHYTTYGAARAIVQDRAIWLSAFTSMNDVSEFTHARDTLLDLLRERRVHLDLVPRLMLVSTLQSFQEGIDLLLCSLSIRSDDLSQWRSYGDKARGCVVGIDATFLKNEAGVAVRRVVYETSEVERLLCAGISLLQDSHEDNPQDFEELHSLSQHLVAELFSIKHAAFADEREVRICRMLTVDEQGVRADVGGTRADGSSTPSLELKSRVGPFGPTHFLSLPLTREDGTLAIKTVGFGPSADPQEKVEGTALFESAGLEVWHSSLPFRT